MRGPARALVVAGLSALALAACSDVPPDEVSSPGGTPASTSTASPGTEAPNTEAPGTEAPAAAREYAAELLRLTNDVRAEHDLPALEPSACAVEQASARAQDLVGADELTHAPLDGVLEACSPASLAAENLASGGASAQRVVEAWMESPGHRANVLEPEVTTAGAGCVEDDGQGLVCSMIYLG